MRGRARAVVEDRFMAYMLLHKIPLADVSSLYHIHASDESPIFLQIPVSLAEPRYRSIIVLTTVSIVTS